MFFHSRSLFCVHLSGSRMTEYEGAQEDQKVQLRSLRNTNDFQEQTNRELGER